jgi:TolA-binding protein
MMKNIVPKEDCLTELQLLRYLHDDCSADVMRAIDHHLTHCPMCSDALEGAMLLGKGRLERSLKHLDAQIKTQFSDRTTVSAIESPVLRVVKKPKRQLWLWAAASIALLVTAGIVLFTKPIDPLSTLPTVANTEGVTSASETPTESTITAQNDVSQANSLKNEGQTGVDNSGIVTKTPATDKTDENSVVATTASGGRNDVESKLATTPNTAEDAAFVQRQTKDEDAQLQDLAVADSYKKTNGAKEKQVQAAPTTSQSDNNYPGAAAQNVVIERQGRAAKAKQSVDNSLADYQIGMQYYTKGDYNSAIAQLNRVLAKQNKGVVYEDALWHLANSYLKLGKKQEGKAVLGRIVAEKGKYSEQAMALLK